MHTQIVSFISRKYKSHECFGLVHAPLANGCAAILRLCYRAKRLPGLRCESEESESSRFAFVKAASASKSQIVLLDIAIDDLFKRLMGL
jgi:hypothetical protein